MARVGERPCSWGSERPVRQGCDPLEQGRAKGIAGSWVTHGRARKNRKGWRVSRRSYYTPLPHHRPPVTSQETRRGLESKKEAEVLSWNRASGSLCGGSVFNCLCSLYLSSRVSDQKFVLIGNKFMKRGSSNKEHSQNVDPCSSTCSTATQQLPRHPPWKRPLSNTVLCQRQAGPGCFPLRTATQARSSSPSSHYTKQEAVSSQVFMLTASTVAQK